MAVTGGLYGEESFGSVETLPDLRLFEKVACFTLKNMVRTLGRDNL